MITDPLFYLVAIPGVLVFGISKGGFAGGFGIVTVPLMALVVPPAQAAAIMLPILLVMDLGAVWAYRRDWDRDLMRTLLPGGLLGTVIGAISFRWLDASTLRVVLGAMSIAFVVQRLARHAAAATGAPPAAASGPRGMFYATLSGITSFVAHAGGPPLSIYLLPLRLPPTRLVGTVAVLFFFVNWSKVAPYGWLGLLSTQNLTTAAVMAPVGVAGIALGVWLHRKVQEALFYRLVYGFLLLTGAKLLYDGLRGWAG